MQRGFSTIHLLLAVLIAGGLIAAGFYLGKTNSSLPSPRPLLPVDSNNKACIQVITPAKNQTTGECKNFPTPCDVPEGWMPIDYCSNEGSSLNNVMTDEDTANWKTYQNVKYSYQFKYPKDWSQKKSLLENYSPTFESPEIRFSFISGKKVQNRGLAVTAYMIGETSKNLSQLEEEDKNRIYIGKTHSDEALLISVEKIKVNEVGALKEIWDSEIDAGLTYRLIYDNKEYGFTCTYPSNQKSSSTDLKLCEKILSTFKFLK